MSGGKHFKCILVYSALGIRVSKRKSFRLQDINLAPMRASDLVLLNRHSDSKRATYANFLFDYLPLKPEPYRFKITVDGEKIEYPDDASSPAASLLI